MVKFSSFNVTSQVFYQTAKSFAITNLRPIFPGHVLVCPLRPVPRFTQLEPDEVADLFLAVHTVSRAIEQFYGADALNIAIQDGALAGQSVDHVHCHIIPRKLHDLPNIDDVYALLNRNDVGAAHQLMRERNAEFRGPDDESRTNRSDAEMSSEAATLHDYIQANF